MARFLKFTAGIFLLPSCWGLVPTIASLVSQGLGPVGVWIPLAAGAACWGVFYWLLPKPMWTYVLGHELTHAVWAWLFGARVTRLAVSQKGGHVIVSKTNFLIALAPYFFPFYAICIALIYAAVAAWFDKRVIAPWFHLVFGAAYGFHFTMNADVLRTRQPDLVEHGYFFSFVIIWIGNAVMVLLTLSLLLEGTGGWKVLGAAGRDCAAAYMDLSRFLANSIHR